MGDSQINRLGLICGLAMLGVLSAVPDASALEFGPISLDSQLNQPLVAQLKLSSLTASEKSSLDVHIASSALFKRFGIKRSSDVDNLQVTTHAGKQPDQVRVDIVTHRPVREPFVDFLLEASTSSGRGLREYTVLLNPTGATSTASSSGNQNVAHNARQRVSTGSAASPAAATDQTASVAKAYARVHAGDTLSGIAAASRPPGATTAQMTVALFEANPQAFSGGMDHLRRGVRLNVPKPRDVQAVDRDEAGARLARARESGSRTRDQANTQNKIEPNAADTAQASGQAPPASLSQRSKNNANPKPKPKPTKRIDAPAASGAQAAGVAGNPAFGQLSMPRTETWSDQQTTPVSNVDVEPDADDSGDGAQTQAAAQAPAQPVETGATSAASADGDAVPPSDGAATTESAEPAPEAVTEGGDSSWWSSRNLLLGGFGLVLVTVGLIVYRRRTYKPVPMDFDAIDPDDDEGADAAPSTPRTVAESSAASAATAAVDESSLDSSDATPESSVVSAATGRVTQAEMSADNPASPTTTASGNPDSFVPAILRNRQVGSGVESDGDAAPTLEGSQSQPDQPDDQAIQDAADDGTPDASMEASDESTDPEPADYDVADDLLPSAAKRQHDQGSDDEWSYDFNQDWHDQGGHTQQDTNQPATTPRDLIDPQVYSLEDPPEQDAAHDVDSDRDNVEIRLDLARMYLDMEAPDMAREVLEDVIEHASNTQTTEAKSLLEQC